MRSQFLCGVVLTVLPFLNIVFLVNTATLNEPCLKFNHSNASKRISINETISKNLTMKDVESYLTGYKIQTGGQWSPSDCRPLHKVAIIVPYRNRAENLRMFLRHMHPFLSQQLLEYRIFLVEPVHNMTFNRGLLMNIGFTEAAKLSDWDCYVYHDIDMLPENERNSYACSTMPKHFSSAVNVFRYQLPYPTIFGGVSSLTRKQMIDVNGFSNLYFGWGGEDDDFVNRIYKKGYEVSRNPMDIGRYYMLQHPHEKVYNPNIYALLNSVLNRMKTDGLNSLDYDLVLIEHAKLFTRFVVAYNQTHLVTKKYF